MTREISPNRKGAYYGGTALVIFGVLLFASTFVTFAAGFGDSHHFAPGPSSMMLRPLVGMGFIVVGGILRSIGARGLAGSGVLLDPSQARKDLEPYTRMAGGMLQDALEETDLTKAKGDAEPVVMIKCRACGKLNEEDSKFCQECGKAL
ncbi:MAG TPA: zinc ribbon domain-containing protein [Planctomycetes bacterium]|nr:zinc ribbon domain-containing protein [Planctomycetota bacterium]